MQMVLTLLIHVIWLYYMYIYLWYDCITYCYVIWLRIYVTRSCIYYVTISNTVISQVHIHVIQSYHVLHVYVLVIWLYYLLLRDMTGRMSTVYRCDTNRAYVWHDLVFKQNGRRCKRLLRRWYTWHDSVNTWHDSVNIRDMTPYMYTWHGSPICIYVTWLTLMYIRDMAHSYVYTWHGSLICIYVTWLTHMCGMT